MVKWSSSKEKMNETGADILVEWSCGIERNQSMRILVLGRMAVHKKRINERGPYILVKWSCGNERNQSMRILVLGRMAVHKKRINERGPCILSFCSWYYSRKRGRGVSPRFQLFVFGANQRN